MKKHDKEDFREVAEKAILTDIDIVTRETKKAVIDRNNTIKDVDKRHMPLET